MTSDAPSWDQLRDEAADWLAAMDSGQVSRESFEKWRDADPRHAAAFAQVAGALMELDRVKPALKERVAPVRPVSRRALIWTVACGLVMAAGAGTYAVATAKSSVRTGIGERKSVALQAGGVLQVNTGSQVQYRSRDRLTEIWLQNGELALDLSRSIGECRLYAADKVVSLTSAVINARLRGKILDLAVLSGVGSVSPQHKGGGDGSSQAGPLIVHANNAVLTGAAHDIVRPLDEMDAGVITAWPKGELVFQGQTLETAVGEYNRYLGHKIIIADASIAATQLGGRFTTRDPSAFLKALNDSFGIRATEDSQGNIALTK